MYDMSEIEKMDFKELRTSVQELYDQYVKLKRTLDDALYNIDESNLATTFRKKLKNNESMLKITAESIESRVSYEDLENNLRQYSTIKQTADQIQMSVVQSQEYTDSATEELSSTFTMTADRISTNVVKLNKKVDGNYTKLYSSLTQTAEAIETIVGKEMTESFEKTTMPTADNTTDAQKEMLCVYGGQKYYFNKITQTWRGYNGSVESAFKQTADGFELNGCVSVSGDLITSGTITGTNLAGGKIYNDKQTAYLELGMSGNLGDMRLYRASGDEIFKVYDNATNVMFYGLGNCFINVGESGTVYPRGTWDFSSCNITGLPTGTSE